MDLTVSYMDNPKKRPKKRQLRHLIELDFLSLSPLHRCRTNPFMQFYDPLAANVIYFWPSHQSFSREINCLASSKLVLLNDRLLRLSNLDLSTLINIR